MRLLTVGVFDMLHIGHILLFQHAKEIYKEKCKLIVAVQDGDYILKYKPNTKIICSTDERLYMVKSIRYVDEVCVYKDVDVDIQNIDFDVFIIGPDQNHDGFKRAVQWCHNNNKPVVVIPRTEGISSSMLKEYCKI